MARDLPVTLEIPGKDASTATVADVKAAFASKYPKVRGRVPEMLRLLTRDTVLRVSPKAVVEG